MCILGNARSAAKEVQEVLPQSAISVAKEVM